jgi:NADH:ubiquinone reductase (H+-translocating)
MKKKVCIIGGGFAGCAAAKYLAQYKDVCELILIDKKNTRDFLPLLPDVAGGTIKDTSARYDLRRLQKSRVLEYRNGEVLSIDTTAQTLTTSFGECTYDYLLIACGSRTNFYGNDYFKIHASALDCLADARALEKRVLTGEYSQIVVSGGGYTGVEIATHLWCLCKTNNIPARIMIIERSERILGSLPEWIEHYVSGQLSLLGISVKCSVQIDSLRERVITLSDGECFENALLVWSAGVCVDPPRMSPHAPRAKQERFVVDDYLRINHQCFAAGDAAGYSKDGNLLRMSVQASLMQGRVAAGNIIRHIKKKPLKRFKPLDLGYIVPMAHGRGCGVVLGINVKGLLAIGLHYLMCIYRSSSPHAMMGLARDLMRKKRCF